MDKTHPAIAKRLRRASGHLDHVLEMLGEGRSCVELAQQLYAVEKAISGAKKALIHDHINHCLEDSSEGSSSKQARKLVGEFNEMAKYL